MPIQSVGSAISEGIVQGAQLGLQATNQRERAEDRKTLLAQREQERQDRITDRNEANVDKSLARDRLAKQDERQATQDQRALLKDELSMVQAEADEVTKAFTAASVNGFDNIDPNLKQQLIQKQLEVDKRLREARKKFANPQIAADETKAKEFMARVQSGQANFDTLNPHEKYKTMTYMLRRPVEDFMRPDENTPSKIEQAALDVRAGLDGQNQELLLKGVNVLWATELAKGVGELRSDGSKIIKKQVVDMVPHPEDPTKFVPIVNVWVQRQDGAKSTKPYKAPVTVERSSDPTDIPKVIDIDDAMEDMGKKETLANIFQGRYAKDLQEGAKTARAEVEPFLKDINAEFVQAATMRGVSPPKKKFTRERINQGNQWQINKVDDQANVVETTYEPIHARPKAGSGSGDGEAGVGITGPNEKAGQAATAAALGVPVATSTPGANLTPKERDKLLSKVRLAADKTIEGYKEEVTNAKDAAAAARRFLEIQAGEPIQQGIIAGMGPAVTAAAKEMDGITGELQPKMRVPGSGTSTDADMRIFRSATLSRDKSKEQNETIAKGLIARAEIATQRQAFLRDYLEVNNHLDGAERQWDNYLAANPIFTKDSTPNRPVLNEKRKSYQEFFKGGGQPAPTEPEGKTGQKPSGTLAAPAQAPGINVQSKTPPKEFRAKGKNAQEDYAYAIKAVEANKAANNEAGVEAVRKRLIEFGYPEAVVRSIMK
jgi:hypothetical protein